MNKTIRHSIDMDRTLTTDIKGLSEMLNCGNKTALEIGTAAGAKIKVGRRVLYSVPKVRTYLDSICE